MYEIQLYNNIFKKLIRITSLLLIYYYYIINDNLTKILWVYGTNIKLTQRNNHANISELLDNLLRGYDNSIRPDFGGPPAIVEVDIMVRSMGPISEVDMTYSMDCYFRQSWVDKRLAFKGAQDTLALSVSMLARIWKPDTYFYNGKQSYLHTITTPNKFVRIYQDGRVLYSSRLTIKAGCPMNLEDFPMDIQRCPLKFGSFGYTTKDVIYRWNGARQAVAIAEDMKLSQFDLVDCPAGNSTDTILKTTPISVKNDGSIKSESDFVASYQYSMLMVNFHLQRHMGNFLIQVYGPCCLLVILSWVSFWLNREATADRISLGITTVLTMTFLGLEARTDLPKVPYLTALDFFVFLSFAFIFATILQFAVVHYFTKYGSGECYFIIDQYDSEESESDNNMHSNVVSKGGSGGGVSGSSSGVKRIDSGSGGSNITTGHSSRTICGTSSGRISSGSTGIIRGRSATDYDDDDDDDDDGDEITASSKLLEQISTKTTVTATTTATTIDLNDSTEDETKIFEVIPLSVCSIPIKINGKSSNKYRKQYKNTSWFKWNCFKRKNKTACSNTNLRQIGTTTNENNKENIKTARKRLSFHHHHQNEQSQYRRKRKRQPHFNSVSKIDRASRIVFPILFFIINVFYWCAYLARSSRWTPATDTAT